jgi:AcrR family transcriptional regulator
VIDPVEARSDDPIERVFELLAQYRAGMTQAGCRMGCPIGNLALEVSDDHAEARELIHRNFENWVAEVQGWLDAAGERLPRDLDRTQLARFVLTVMEGGLMQARAARDLRPFDDSVAQLRVHFDTLEAAARGESAAGGGAVTTTGSRSKPRTSAKPRTPRRGKQPRR